MDRDVRPAPEGDDAFPPSQIKRLAGARRANPIEAQSTFGHGVDSRGLAVAGEG
jgi:hypothetical protein